MHALPRVKASIPTKLRGKYENDFIYHNDEYETEYHHCARNIELPEKLRVSASESVIETDI